jgi:hypothetical protein
MLMGGTRVIAHLWRGVTQQTGAQDPEQPARQG